MYHVLSHSTSWSFCCLLVYSDGVLTELSSAGGGGGSWMICGTKHYMRPWKVVWKDVQHLQKRGSQIHMYDNVIVCSVWQSYRFYFSQKSTTLTYKSAHQIFGLKWSIKRRVKLHKKHTTFSLILKNAKFVATAATWNHLVHRVW